MPSFVEIGSVWKRKLKKKILLFYYYYLPMNEGMLHHLNKLEFPLPKDNLFQVWLKLA